jgi:hypothetical protein
MNNVYIHPHPPFTKLFFKDVIICRPLNLLMLVWIYVNTRSDLACDWGRCTPGRWPVQSVHSPQATCSLWADQPAGVAQPAAALVPTSFSRLEGKVFFKFVRIFLTRELFPFNQERAGDLGPIRKWAGDFHPIRKELKIFTLSKHIRVTKCTKSAAFATWLIWKFYLINQVTSATSFIYPG